MITFFIAAISVWRGIWKHGFPINDVISNAAAIPLHILLMQSWFNFSAWKYNGVAWFLSTIMVCYFLMPCVLKLLDKLDSSRNLVILILFTLIIKFGFPHIGIYVHSFNFGFFAYVNPISRFWDFLLGCAAGTIFLKNDNFHKKMSPYIVDLLQIGSIVLYVGAVILGGGGQSRGQWIPVVFLILSSILIYTLALSKWGGGIKENHLIADTGISWGD